MAVKVLHKSLSQTAHVDIATVYALVDALHRIYPTLNFKWLADEIHTNLPLEMDFTHEADNLTRCRHLITRPDVRFPIVFHSTPRVLVMEFMEGARVTDVAALRRLNLAPRDAARLLSEVFCEMIFFHGFVHCDPHPGNLLIRRGPSGAPELVLLDHGLYVFV